jgi:hypothetical protein
MIPKSGNRFSERLLLQTTRWSGMTIRDEKSSRSSEARRGLRYDPLRHDVAGSRASLAAKPQARAQRCEPPCHKSAIEISRIST